MSRQLPLHPNLEYLKKQAKELLPELRRNDPHSQLADALHALAREYGFTTWPQLKAHVESLPRNVESPFVGMWIANVSKSTADPEHPFRRAMLRFDVSGDSVTITDVVVDASDREEKNKNVIHADGRSREQAHGYVIIARWLSAHRLECVVTKNSQPAGRVTYEVSADRKTLTLSTDKQVAVFDRA
jgi:hypothetical protein